LQILFDPIQLTEQEECQDLEDMDYSDEEDNPEKDEEKISTKLTVVVDFGSQKKRVVITKTKHYVEKNEEYGNEYHRQRYKFDMTYDAEEEREVTRDYKSVVTTLLISNEDGKFKFYLFHISILIIL
jgi:hypothetical protein